MILLRVLTNPSLELADSMQIRFFDIETCNINRVLLRLLLLHLGLSTLWMFFSHVFPSFFTSNPTLIDQLEVGCDVLLIVVTGCALVVVARKVLLTIQQHEDRFHNLVNDVCANQGGDFFPTLVKSLTQMTDTNYALVCRSVADPEGDLRTVAAHGDGQPLGDFDFSPAGTACDAVLRDGKGCFPAGVREAFPQDAVAARLQIDHFVGVALRDSKGKSLGLMALLGRGHLRKRRLCESLLQLFSVRAAAVLEGERNREVVDYMTLYDKLTGLPNRQFFSETVEPALAHAQRSGEMVGVMFLDLDRFKNINDGLGHGVGDRVLQMVSDRLKHSLRRGDFIARLGGDEFMVLLPGLSEKMDAVNVARKVFDALGPPFCVDGNVLHIASSIGIALFPEHGDTVEALLKNADTAMNRAKDLGRNTYQFFDSAMSALSMTRLGLEADIREALLRNDFALYYQPQYDIETGAISGAEALIRWIHPDQGLIGPDRFIPMAEETGLIVPMGKWVLYEACAQNAAWQKSGMKPVVVAVNLSARQFQDQDLAEVVERALGETGLDPACLELEITESILMQDLETTIDQLVRLVDLGIKISIDDFGTGYSSLSYLKRFPLHSLKIDRSFVKDIGEDCDDASIVSAVIALAHTMNLDVVAEGVETPLQLEFLRSQRCNRFQGYLKSPPVPAEKFRVLLQASQGECL